jgi:hypothetical protein
MITIKIETAAGEFEYEISDPVESNETGYVMAIEQALARHCRECGVPFEGYFDELQEQADQ